MRVVCSFCNTGFNAARAISECRCPICGRKNIIKKKSLFSPLILFLGFLAAISVFSAAYIYYNDERLAPDGGLFVSISAVRALDNGYVIEGVVKNTSDVTRSVPDLVFNIRNSQGILLVRETTLPPTGLAMPGAEIKFKRIVGPKIIGANSLSVTFAE